ncbi:MAG: homoserine kinase [Gemmataceae bacterium]|nr:homoserine kinase [Gemmataceae bacterium]
MDAVIEALTGRATEALSHWNLPAQVPELLKYRENAVFKVRLESGEPAALRLHRPGYHSEAGLRSELAFMKVLGDQGLDVPKPIATKTGALLAPVAGEEMQFVDLIGWVDGRQVGESGKPLDHSDTEVAGIYRKIGEAMARLHAIADRWQAPAGFTRPSWDAAGLGGDQPLWGRFWDSPDLAKQDREFLTDLRQRLQGRMEALPPDLDYGLIHADLVRENVLVDNGRIALIDFDDCGYGWRLFDVATALLRNRREPRYPLITSSLIEGYRSHRALDEATLAHLPFFLLLRGVTYIGWAAERPELPDHEARLARYTAEVRDLAREAGL